LNDYLTEIAPLVQDQHFMLQKEVVERMVAPPGSKTYGRLSVMLQWRYVVFFMRFVDLHEAITQAKPLANVNSTGPGCFRLSSSTTSILDVKFPLPTQGMSDAYYIAVCWPSSNRAVGWAKKPNIICPRK
jgi:hypothetical protein